MIFRILFTTSIIFFCFFKPSIAGELIATFEDETHIDGEKVTVHISSYKFTPESIGVDFTTNWKINGKRPLGGFPSRPTSRIGMFFINWDGKRYNVPLLYYEDCFDPNLRKKQGWWDNEGGISVRPADNNKAMLIEMEVSQIACCGYSVIWTISHKGHVTRTVDSSIP